MKNLVLITLQAKVKATDGIHIAGVTSNEFPIKLFNDKII